MDNFLPLVSIIIPTHGKRDLSLVTQAINESSYKHVEIIIVNEGKERSAQRNIGIDRSKGKYLLFLDSDMMIHKSLITECVWTMERYSLYQGFYIPEIIKTKGLFGTIRNWERQFYTGTLIDVVRFVRACNCPKFDESMSGPEDTDWERRINGKKETSYFPYYHYEDINFISYFKKKAYYAKSMGEFQKKNPYDKILSFKYRCFDVFVENGKWIKFVSNPFFALCVLFTLFVRGIIYKLNK